MKRKLDDITESLVSLGPATCVRTPQGTPQGQAGSDNLEGGAAEAAQRLCVNLGGGYCAAASPEKQVRIALLLVLTICWWSWQLLTHVHTVCDVRKACMVKPTRLQGTCGHLGAATGTQMHSGHARTCMNMHQS